MKLLCQRCGGEVEVQSGSALQPLPGSQGEPDPLCYLCPFETKVLATAGLHGVPLCWKHFRELTEWK